MVRCDHLVGYTEGDGDSYGRCHSLSELYPRNDWRWFKNADEIEERFTFCPTCGEAIDWTRIASDQQRNEIARQEHYEAEERAKKRRAKEAAERKQFSDRMRGAEYETW